MGKRKKNEETEQGEMADGGEKGRAVTGQGPWGRDGSARALHGLEGGWLQRGQEHRWALQSWRLWPRSLS